MSTQNNQLLNLDKAWAIKKTDFERLQYVSKSNQLEQEKKFAKAEIRTKNNTAIITIRDAIFRYDNIYSWLFGGSTIEGLSQQLETALSDNKVDNVLLDINSPGGEVDGTPEFAEMVFNARNIKPILAYVSYDGASAAYWIASAASKIVLHESASVGSIGVIAQFESENESDTIEIVSSVSPNKIADLNTDKGLSQIQSHVDSLGAIFVKTVAKHRGENAQDVLDNFGGGDVVMGYEAVSRNMADTVGNFKSALALVNSLSINSANKNKVGNNVSKQANKKISEDLSDEKNQVEIDKDWILENKPDLAEEFRKEGREEENSRLSEIDTIEVESAEEKEIVKNAKSDLKKSAALVALSLNQLNAQKRKSYVNRRNADAKNIPDVNLESDQNDNVSVLASMKKGLSSKVGALR